MKPRSRNIVVIAKPSYYMLPRIPEQAQYRSCGSCNKLREQKENGLLPPREQRSRAILKRTKSSPFFTFPSLCFVAICVSSDMYVKLVAYLALVTETPVSFVSEYLGRVARIGGNETASGNASALVLFKFFGGNVQLVLFFYAASLLIPASTRTALAPCFPRVQICVSLDVGVIASTTAEVVFL